MEVSVLPQSQYLYRHFDKDGALLYVGISLSPVYRLSQHREASAWFKEIRNVTIVQFDTRKEALSAEKSAIISEKPIHNKTHRKAKYWSIDVKRDFDGFIPDGIEERSRKDITVRVVNFRPVYTMEETSSLFGWGDTKNYTQKLIDRGVLGYFQVPNPRSRTGKLRTFISGWQIIDYLENIEKVNPVKSPQEEK